MLMRCLQVVEVISSFASRACLRPLHLLLSHFVIVAASLMCLSVLCLSDAEQQRVALIGDQGLGQFMRCSL